MYAPSNSNWGIAGRMCNGHTTAHSCGEQRKYPISGGGTKETGNAVPLSFPKEWPHTIPPSLYLTAMACSGHMAGIFSFLFSERLPHLQRRRGQVDKTDIEFVVPHFMMESGGKVPRNVCAMADEYLRRHISRRVRASRSLPSRFLVRGTVAKAIDLRISNYYSTAGKANKLRRRILTI